METVHNLLMGFAVALTPQNLWLAFVGSVLGTIIGVLPGLGPSAGAAMLIPLTFHIGPTGAIIMLTALFYGTQYGGTVTSVLMNVPGEASSAITCLDGYQMAKQGRAGVALAVAAVGSFIGGTFATMALVVAAGPLSRWALEFGPVEFFTLILLGLSLLTGLAGKSVLKALMMGIFGLILAMVGIDPIRGQPRFTFGQPDLLDGIGFIPIIMGLFGMAEILENAEKPFADMVLAKMSTLMPTRQDVRDSVGPIVRGSLIGTALGLIPGITNSASSFLAYIAERKVSKYPERFGTGMIQGVAGPETANNAHANGALIPLFTLGIPASPTIAVIMGAFLMHGLVPGPFLFKEHPDVVWGVIASFYIGNVILLILNLPLIGIWVKILKIPYGILAAIILAFMILGAYSVSNSAFDVGVMTLFGVLGYVLRKLDFPLAPIVLTLILGPLMERSLRQSLEISQGSFLIFFKSPIAAVFLVMAAVILIAPAFQVFRRGKAALSGDEPA
ncbi:MAG TPA: tripartite tricarboxylate transporter permease [Candidatus Sulfotelmatobacter sp.]|nr:tripartite tricarboxylate transporter permease [Candidatus Sulfotelmatobacter sp.]